MLPYRRSASSATSRSGAWTWLSVVADRCPDLAGNIGAMIGQDSVAASELAVRRACDELSRRLRSGLACEAEEFLAADPAIGSDADAVLELLYTEFIVREQLGEQPRPPGMARPVPTLARGVIAALRGSHPGRAGAGVADRLVGDAWRSGERTLIDDRLRRERDQGSFLSGCGILAGDQERRNGCRVSSQAARPGRIVVLKMMLPPAWCAQAHTVPHRGRSHCPALASEHRADLRGGRGGRPPVLDGIRARG